jgi:RNA polymerase sigma-70 factor (ECF subfamily)
MKQLHDEVLIGCVLAGQQEALRELMLRYGGSMLAAARAIAPHAADDIVQDAWISAVTALAEFEQRATLKTWLIRITMNKAYSVLRQHRLEVSLDGLADSDNPLHDAFDQNHHWRHQWAEWSEQSPQALLESHALQDCLDKHIATLPEGQRLVFVQSQLLELSVDEVCNNLAVSASNLRVLLHRARVKLHAMVAHYQDTGEC